jgi:hypothetical protein
MGLLDSRRLTAEDYGEGGTGADEKAGNTGKRGVSQERIFHLQHSIVGSANRIL